MKTIIKRILAVMTITAIALSLAACGNAGGGRQTDENQETDQFEQNLEQSATSPEMEASEVEESVSETADDKANGDTGKILIVYFSWSGHLDSMAHWVADETGGDLYQVTAKEPYPEDYNATADRAKQEQDDGIRPEIVVDITKEQMAQYDTVFFGFPVWWYDLPMPMWTFLESYDFSGKTIIPFFSHEGSSNGANALPTIESLASGASVRSDDALSIRGNNVDDAENEVREWVNGLGYESDTRIK